MREQHQVLKLEIAEMEQYTVGPEYSDVTWEVRRIFEVSNVRKKASIWSQASGHGMTVKCKGGRKKAIDWKESQSPEVGDRRKWLAAHEDAAKRTLKYLEDNEDVKVSLREITEQVVSLEEADISFMLIAKQARNARGQKLQGRWRMKCASPVGRGGAHNRKDWWNWKSVVRN